MRWLCFLLVVDTVSGLGVVEVEEGAAVVKGEVAASGVTVVVTWFHHVLRDNKGVWNRDSLENLL